MDVPRRLTMTSEYYTVGHNVAGDKVESFSNTIACFAYDDELARTFPNPVAERSFEWTMLLPSTLTAVEVGDVFKNITDKFGNTVLAFGRVKHRRRIDHYRDGTVVMLAYLATN